jgi:dihydrofolate synthase/folylpolyglutamate synthase
MSALDEIFRRESFGIKLGLASMRALCAELGDPQARFPSILVAGTNGKGSVTAMLSAGLRAAGWRTGQYTSPHLVSVNERFVIDGAEAGDDVLEEAAGIVLAAEGRCRADGRVAAPMTFFELTTAVAFEHFRRDRVDAAVVEVGLGGRFDATNVVSPVVSVITTIDFDHMAHLGHSLSQIAREKAGIMRAGVPVVTGVSDGEAAAEIRAAAAEARAPLIAARDGVTAASSLDETGRTRLRLRTPARDYGELTLALRGAHQVGNAIVALRALESVDQATPLRVPPAAIVEGLTRARWPGRLDVRHLPGGRTLILDAAHNPAGASALADYLRDTGQAPLPIVFGVMGDKDVTPMLRQLAPLASLLVFTQVETRRARAADSLPAAARAAGVHVRPVVVPDPGQAIEEAWRAAPGICVTGSIFLIGEILRRLGADARAADDAPARC